MKLGENPRGIVASGIATGTPVGGEHWAERGKAALYVDIDYDAILDPASTPLFDVERKLRTRQKWNPQRSGVTIESSAAVALERAWRLHLQSVWGASPKPRPKPVGPEDVDEVYSGGMEGAVRERVVRHRMREAALREAKIQDVLSRTGRLQCAVSGCGFDFQSTYGALGEGFAHVHHTRPLKDRTAPSLTTLAELEVVCANCHAMIHRGGDCRELRGLIPRRRALRSR